MDGGHQHTNAKLWRIVLCTLVLISTGILAFTVDYPVSSWMSGERLRTVLRGDVYSVVRLSETFSHGVVVTLIVLLIVRIDPRGWRLFPLLTASSLGAGLVANCCKLLVARTRPSKHVLIGDAFNSFGSWLPGDLGHDLQSFPSAHTAVGVGFAFALTRLYPRGAAIFWLFASLAALQRVEGGAHYVSDIVFGAGLGILMAYVSGWMFSNYAAIDSVAMEPIPLVFPSTATRAKAA